MKTPKPPSGTLTTSELSEIITLMAAHLDGREVDRSTKILKSALAKLIALRRPVKKREFDPQTARCKCGQALSGHLYTAPHPCSGHGSTDDPDYFEECPCEAFVPA